MTTPLQLSETLSFQQERAQDCFIEAKPMLEAHWAEVAHYPDIPFDPDLDAYVLLENAGMLRAYTVRERGEMKGYAVFFLRADIHYRSALYAACDIIYLDPALRGGMLAARFIMWCDEQLKLGAPDGTLLISHHVKFAHDWTPLLKRLGYEPVDAVWFRRMD